jgi:hypothetical protein
MGTEVQRLIEVHGPGDWVFYAIVASWFLADLVWGRADAVRGIALGASFFVALIASDVWYWRIGIFFAVHFVVASVLQANRLRLEGPDMTTLRLSSIAAALALVVWSAHGRLHGIQG